MLKPSWLFVCLLLLASLPSYAQQIIHHEILANILPGEHKIKVIDVVSLDESMSQHNTPLYFLLHEGPQPKISTKDAALSRLSDKKMASIFPAHVRESMVPVAAYQIQLADGKRKFTLEYELEINHAIMLGGEESARSISESPGLILPRGVYLAGESLWYPRFADELVRFRLSVKLPKGWKSVSQGQRVYVEDEKNYHLDTWQESHSQDDIYLIAAKFHEYDQQAGAVKAMAFLREKDDGLAQKYLDATADYLKMYSQLLGPYPYSKFALVENFWETGFGMPSFTLLGQQIIRFPFILHSSYPHELLHNWWGNSVYVDYEQGNWAEGLTAYLADHLIKELKDQGALHRRAVLQKYTNFTQAGGDFPLSEFVSRHNAVTEAVGYGKTLMLFHMLRQKIGDDLFRKGLQQFYMQYRYKVASYKDIESVFSKVSRQNLKPFFKQWVERTGAPILALKDVSLSKTATGQFQLSFTIEQQQKAAAYQLEVPVYVYLKNQKIAKKEIIKLNTRDTHINLVFNSEPVGLDVDATYDVFRKLDVNETPPSLSQIFGASDVLIILSTNETPKLKMAYEQLAKSWRARRSQNISLIYDNELSDLPADKSIWIFGDNNKFKSNVIKSLSLYDVSFNKNITHINNNKIQNNENSIVLVGRHPLGSEKSLAFISVDNAAAVVGLGRKLPHYGKYSYLAFQGEAPDNFVKGQWPVVNSPLSFRFKKTGFKQALPKQQALVDGMSVFSKQQLMQHVSFLASKKMKGRGLGSKALDQAANYIAAVFKEAGLQQFPGSRDYFQQWSQNVNGFNHELRLTNVIGVLPGSNPKYQNESVIVAAHYDHLGMGKIVSRKGNKGKLHYGANDNASGVAVMLELAKYMASKSPPERTIIFVAFTGEEHNRLGSKYYVKNLKHYPLDKIMGVVNFDAVGRLGDKPLSVFSTHSASEWVHILRGAGYVTGVKIKSVSKNIGASDDESFLDVNVPAVHFFSGVNDDFHSPSDTVGKIDADGLVKVALVAKETVDYLAAREEPLTNQLTSTKPKRHNKTNSGRRVSLGTVPDFTFAGPGVKVTDVVKASPAEKAGVQKNDIIRQINQQVITDLRGFSSVLRSLKPNDRISIIIERNGKRYTLYAVVVAR